MSSLTYRFLLGLTCASLIVFFLTVFFYIPFEATQGVVQKVFFFHVPSAIVMKLGYLIGVIGGLVYLIQRKESAFHWAMAGIEVGFMLNTVVLVSGPLWAKPIWGVWWVWEPRLTSTLILWLTYLSYLMMTARTELSRGEKTAASVLGVLAFLNIPIVHYSVQLWRGVHPSVVQEPGGLPPSMKLGLAVGVCLFAMLFALLFWKRVELLTCEHRIRELEIRAALLKPGEA